MIAHVVLFKPRGDLDRAGRDALLNAIREAHRAIPRIARFRVGVRMRTGRPYDALARDFPFFALVEFASTADLEAYLSHPAHEDLGAMFYRASDAAEAYDFVVSEVPEGLEALLP